MITVLQVNKQGNRILSYTCTDGKTNKDISKEQLIQYIDAKQVTNAKKQIYKGQIIVRVKTNNNKGNTKSERNNTVKNDVISIAKRLNYENSLGIRYDEALQNMHVIYFGNFAYSKTINDIIREYVLNMNSNTLDVKLTDTTPYQNCNDSPYFRVKYTVKNCILGAYFRLELDGNSTLKCIGRIGNCDDNGKIFDTEKKEYSYINISVSTAQTLLDVIIEICTQIKPDITRAISEQKNANKSSKDFFSLMQNKKCYGVIRLSEDSKEKLEQFIKEYNPKEIIVATEDYNEAVGPISVGLDECIKMLWEGVFYSCGHSRVRRVYYRKLNGKIYIFGARPSY